MADLFRQYYIPKATYIRSNEWTFVFVHLSFEGRPKMAAQKWLIYPVSSIFLRPPTYDRMSGHLFLSFRPSRVDLADQKRSRVFGRPFYRR